MNSLLDDVNALLKLKKGDIGRLEHIKKTLESRNILYISDTKYLQELTKEYLEDHTGKILRKEISYDFPEKANRIREETTFESKPSFENVKKSEPEKIETSENSFCGNCGSSIKDENFCPKCGYALRSDKHETDKVETTIKKEESEKKEVRENKGMGIGKKLLIGLGVIFVVIIVGGIAIAGSFVVTLDNNERGTLSNNFQNSQIITIGESKNLGNVLVNIDKIEFHEKYAKIFLSVENLGSDEAHLYETSTYVIQGKTQFKAKIPKPLGASGDWIDGYNMPPQTIREGIIFLESWNPNEPYELILDGSYIKQDAFGGLIKDMQFVFNFEPKVSVSKCGAGTVFDEVTNTCVLEFSTNSVYSTSDLRLELPSSSEVGSEWELKGITEISEGLSEPAIHQKSQKYVWYDKGKWSNSVSYTIFPSEIDAKNYVDVDVNKIKEKGGFDEINVLKPNSCFGWEKVESENRISNIRCFESNLMIVISSTSNSSHRDTIEQALSFQKIVLDKVE